MSKRGEDLKYETIALAGLFHDIGKFLQKGDFELIDVKGKHPDVSARFVRAFSKQLSQICDVELLESLVMKHHEPNYYPDELRVQSLPKDKLTLAYLISRADNYSSTERGEPDDKHQDYKKRPLDAVFGRLDIGKGQAPIMQYLPKTYCPEDAFPLEGEIKNEKHINYLLKNFGREFKEIINNITNFTKFYNLMYSLLLKYAWCIPSNSHEKIADISLFDHLKTTSAIAACLYQYHKNIDDFSVKAIKEDSRKKFKLLIGDSTGIQEYIFSGANVGSGGVANFLRARSFFITIITELVAQKVLNSCDLYISNILMSSGGKFYILLPNTDEIQKKITEIQKELDEYVLKEFHGELSFNLVCEELSGSDFEHFGSIVSNINKKLALKKNMVFDLAIKDKAQWKEDAFLFEMVDAHGKGLCDGCEKEFAVKEIDDKAYGPRCLQDLGVGKKLPRIKYLEITSDAEVELGILDIGVRLLNELPKQDSNNLLVALNDNTIYPGRSMIFSYLANYVAHEDYQIKSFDEISHYSKGIKRLAFLKADVDNLGTLFASGLKNQEEGQKNYDTISRITTLSRMLDLFFSGRINQIINDDYPNCYIVFSGGDDLLIIGPWDEIIELSIRINSEFRDFVGYNDNITLSAGINLVKTKTPIVKAVESTNELLEKSKETVLKGKQCGRNQVTIFNRTMSWEGYEQAVTEGEQLENWVGENQLNMEDLWKLKKYDDLFQDFFNNKNIEGLKYQSFLAYDIGRKKKENRISEKVVKWEEGLFNLVNPSLINLGVSTDYAICASREGK